MKKRLFVLLFALVVLVGVMVMPASAAATQTAACQHCGSEDVVWYSLNDVDMEAGYDHYYLSNDLPLSEQIALQDKSICLDLNGYTLTGSPRAFVLRGTTKLSVMDSSVAQSGEMVGRCVSVSQSGGTVSINAGCELNIYGGTFSYDATNGNAAYGAVMWNMGTVNVYDGKIVGGSANNKGGAICMHDDASRLNVYGGEITAGSAVLGGNCVASREGDGIVTVGADAQIDEICYLNVPTTDTFQTVAPGNDFAFTGGVVRNENKVTVYNSFAKAVENAGTGYVMLSADVDTLDISKDVTIDLNGNNITNLNATNGATVKLRDSMTDDYDCADGDYGKVVNISGNVVGAKNCLAITDTEGTSYHSYSMELVSVTLRPGKNGMYYKSAFAGDTMVVSQIDSFGTALRIGKAPDASSMKRGSYSAFAPEEFGGESNSTILVDILKSSNIVATNQYNTNLKVYGRAYIKLTDGSYLFTDVNEDHAYSLRTLTEKISATYTVNELEANEDLMEMYRKFSAVMSSWDIQNIKDAYAANQTEDDQTTNILLIGNSSCFYWTGELWGMMDAAGYEDVNVYNLYYDGASLEQHYNWMNDGTSVCQLHCYNANGRTIMKDVNIKDALDVRQWDYVSILQTSKYYLGLEQFAVDPMDSITPYLGELLSFIREKAPDAQLYWQAGWAYEIGHERSYFTMDTIEKRTAMAERYHQTGQKVSQMYGLPVIPLYAAWESVRDNEIFAVPGTGSGWEKFTLCTRLNSGSLMDDLSHDGDVGGGQYLNACVVYEILTGKDCRENTYRPRYTYNSMNYGLTEEEVSLLQTAAHNAVHPNE